MPVFWWMSLDLVSVMGKTESGAVFCGVCDLIMILMGVVVFTCC